jgi:sulfoxide reductase heme-binding subunit YedZ
MPANTPLLRMLNASWFAWLVLALPGVALTYRYATGELGVRLLMLAMAVTPLKLMFPSAGWLGWLARRRRYIGVAAFGYSLLHAVAYVKRQPAVTAILEQASELALLTGWIALLVMLVLAATSNNAAVRRLRAGWKWLHRTVYVAALLTFAHWVLSAFDPTAAYIHLGVIGALEAFRLVLGYRIRARGSP